MRKFMALFLVGCSGPALPAPTPTAGVDLTPTPPATANMLLNPSFEEDWYNKNFAQQRRFLLLQGSDIGVGEQDGNVDHWTVAPDAWDRATARTGQRSLKFSAPGSAVQRLRWAGENGWQVGGARYGGFLPLEASLAAKLRKRPITIGAWCRTESASAPPRLRVEMVLQDRPTPEEAPLNPATQTSQTKDFEAGTHDWQYREITVTPSGPVNFLHVSLEAVGGTVWFDDCQVLEKPAPDEVNLVPNGGFEIAPGGWSEPVLWPWMRNDYYAFTGWSHEEKRSWRGQAKLDPLIHYSGKAALRFQVYPGDNFAVPGPIISLNQKEPHPLEVRALVRADQIRTVEIMAQDEQGKWLPQGDFLGDDMENTPGLYNMGTTGSGTYDWICLRKFLAPRRPLKSLRLFLCARGFDGVRVPKSTIGTVWFDDVQLYQHGGQAPPPSTRVTGTPVAGLDERLQVDWGERLYGQNTVTVKGTKRSVKLNGQSDLSYRIEKPGQSCQLRLAVDEFSADYTFATPAHLLECEVDRYFAYPDETILAFLRVNVSSREKAALELSVPCKILPPGPLPDFVDARGVTVARIAPQKVHPWTEPTRDLNLVARLRAGDRIVAQSNSVSVGFLEKIPAPQFPARITSTSVDSRGYLRINGQHYFPVYWTPNFERPSEGNYPPRFWGCPSQDLNDLPREQVLQKVAEARANPRFFAYELGDGEMQLQGPGWPLRLKAAEATMGWVRRADPHHLINGPESWLVGHPGHQQAMKTFMPLFDVIGVETSFEEVPEPQQSPNHPCAVLAGLEAYFYQPVESLRWRGYRAVYEGCAGVGLCPSEMLKARPAHVNYLRGLNGEFRGLEQVFTAPVPAQPVRAVGPVQTFERQAGHRYLFALSAPGHKEFPAKVTFQGVSGSVRVRGEARTLEVSGGSFSDTFAGPYTVHVYEF